MMQVDTPMGVQGLPRNTLSATSATDQLVQMGSKPPDKEKDITEGLG